jgi:hypothetical protein
MMISQEYGKRLTLTTGYDLSGATALTIEVQRPDGTVVVYPGQLGSMDAEVVDGRGVRHRLKANEYMYRDWEDGDVNIPGRYRARAVYVDSSKQLRSRQVVFQVIS